MIWSNRRVVVTGGSGVIGRELIERLARRGARVLSLDRTPTEPHRMTEIAHRTLDLGKHDLSSLSRHRPTAIFHLAASFEQTAESPAFWSANWEDNVVASHRLLEAVRRVRGLEVLVFASSYLVYAARQYLRRDPPSVPIRLREDDEIAPRNLCGAAKLYTERELAFLGESDSADFRSVSARIFRVYGRGSRDVISRWVRAVRDGKELVVFQPNNRFDYIHAGDVAEGLVRLAEEGDAEGPVNLGTGKARTITDVLHVLSTIAPKGQVKVRRRAPRGLYEASCADITRLRQIVDWRPPTSLERGIRDVWEFEVGKRGS